jgi:DNA-binding MarR family transcriptional regulator
MEKLDEVLFYTLEKSIKVYRKYAQSQIHMEGLDITIDQWLLLKTLQENVELPQNQIAELVFKDIASTTRIIELLVQKKYIDRKINKADRRKFDLKITKSGEDIIKKVSPIVKKYRKQALLGLTKSNIGIVKEQLEKIISNCINAA